MKLSSKARLSFLVLIILIGSVVVYATTIGPTGVYDTPWGNFTVGVKTPSIELDGITRTTWWGPQVNFTREYDLLIYEQGGTAYAYNSTGGLISSSATHSTAIQAGFDDLPASGTHPDARHRSVLFRGDFDIGTTVEIPAYISVNAYGAKFTLTANVDMFEGDQADASHGNRAVMWYGGVYIGDKATRASGSAFYGAWVDCYFQDLEIIQFADEGFTAHTFSGTISDRTIATQWYACWFGKTTGGTGNKGGGLIFSATGTNSAADCKVIDSWFINNGAFNIKTEYGSNYKFLRNHLAGHPAPGEDMTIGIWMLGQGDRSTIAYNTFENHKYEAVKIEPLANSWMNNIHIDNNYFLDNCKDLSSNNTLSTIYVAGDNVNKRSLNGMITNNYFQNDTIRYCPKHCIELDGTLVQSWVISGNNYASDSYWTSATQWDSTTHLVLGEGMYETKTAVGGPDANGAIGRSVVLYNSTAGTSYLYIYTNGAWQRIAVD